MGTGLNKNKVEPVLRKEENAALTADGNLQFSVDEIIKSCIDPIVKKTICHRLKLSLHPSPKNALSVEAEDIYQTIVLKFFGSNGVRNGLLQNNDLDEIKRYAATIAHNVCNDFFRERCPERYRLKAKLRNLLKRHPDFAYWKIGDKTLCGFVSWTDCVESKRVEVLIREINEQGNTASIDGLDIRSVAGGRLSTLIADLFNWCQGPVDMDNLLFIVAALQGVKEYSVESLECNGSYMRGIPDSPNRCHEQIELRELLAGIWKGINELPRDQQKAFTYTSADQTGESILHRMLRERLVSVSQIYTTLGTTREELASIWESLPMNLGAAAIILGTTNGMISKWRCKAVKKLAVGLGLKKK